MNDPLGIMEDARNIEERRKRNAPRGLEQDLVVVSKGPTRTGKVMIGSTRTGSIVGEVDIEVLEGNVVVTVRRHDESYFGPVSMVVI